MRGPLNLFLLITGLFGGLPAYGGEIFQEPHRLVTLETEHFTFVFAEDQQPVAEYLVSMAEDLYSDVARTLDVPKTLHIPVVLTPDTDDLNGEFTNYPSMRIVCYQAPISPNSGFAIFGDNLKKLFLHELVHAVSLTQTDAFWGFLVALFGDAAYPAPYWAPANLVEGVAVSLESSDGWGRANDTTYAAVIQQAILEDRFPTFTETAGAKGGYPGGIHYIYGSWFSRYLQETYGARFAVLWKQMGRARSVFDLTIFTGAFQEVYGESLDQAWEDFRRWMALKTPVRTDVRPLSPELTYVLATTGANGRFYWADFRGLWTMSGGQPRFLTGLNHLTNRLALSPDGTKLLISTATTDGPLAQAVLREYDLVHARFTDRVFPPHLTEASYLADGGIVACRITGYSTDLVTIEKGVVEVLIQGTAQLCPSVPSLMDDGRILFLLQEKGVHSLAFFDRRTATVSVVDAGLSGIRNLSTDGRRAWFSWDNDHTLFKLGVLEGDSISIYPSLSGGVQFPVGVGDEVFYEGAFARGHRLMVLPALEPEIRPYHLSVRDQSEFLQPGVYDQAPRLVSKPYNPLSWVLWPQTRFPLLFLDGTNGLSHLVRGAGVGTEATDPAGILGLGTRFTWLWNDAYANAEVNTAFHGWPVDVTLGVFDHLTPHPDAKTTLDLRTWGARLGMSDAIQADLSRWDWSATLGWVEATQGEAFHSPYGWGRGTRGLTFSGTLGFSDIRETNLQGEKMGVSGSQAWDAVYSPSAGGLPPGLSQTDLGLSLPFLRFHLGGTGVISTSPTLALGTGGPVLSDGSPWLGEHRFEFPDLYTGASELTDSWLVQGKSDVGFDLPIGMDLPLGFYANSLDLQVGYRGLVFAGAYLDAVFAIVALDFRPGIVPGAARVPYSVGLKIEQALWGSQIAPGPRLSLYFDESLY